MTFFKNFFKFPKLTDKVKTFKSGEFIEKKAMDLYPGEVIKIEQGEEIPADCFLMKVTNKRNCCYFETTNINNNKNLEKKTMPIYVEGKNESDPIEFLNLYVNNSVSCDLPNSDLNSFNGSLSTVGKPIKLSFGKLFFKFNLR